MDNLFFPRRHWKSYPNFSPRIVDIPLYLMIRRRFFNTMLTDVELISVKMLITEVYLSLIFLMISSTVSLSAESVLMFFSTC